MPKKEKPLTLKQISADTRRRVFFEALRLNGIESPEFEYKFHSERKWRFDYCWPSKMIALEVEGGVFSNGRHTRGTGFMNDIDKYNNAALLGWRLIRTTPSYLTSQLNIELIKEILKER
jgi:hypothetical protein